MVQDAHLDDLVAEYAANKAKADTLIARNAHLAAMFETLAAFRPGSDTGRLEAGGFQVLVTRRVNEKWDQEKLEAAAGVLPLPLFHSLFRRKYEPDRGALKAFMRSEADAQLKALVVDAVSASAGKPAIKLMPLA